MEQRKSRVNVQKHNQTQTKVDYVSDEAKSIVTEENSDIPEKEQTMSSKESQILKNTTFNANIEHEQHQWQKGVLEKYLEENPERKDWFKNDLGHDIKNLYTPKDLEDIEFDYLKDVGFPGQYPYTRGANPNMYRSNTPILRAYSGFGTPEESNKRYKRLLEIGAEEIQMAVDLPTQVGYDSDHLMSTGEVGKVGVAINSLHDMEVLFDGIDISQMRRVGMLGNSFGPIALAFFIILGEKKGLSTDDYVVDLQNDILKEYVARGTYIYPIEPSVRLTLDTVEYCIEHMPHWNPISACVNHLNGGGTGSSAGTAFAIKNTEYYVERLLERGHDIDAIAPMFSMFLDERDDFFTEIANLRATRKVWADMMKNRFGAKTMEAQGLKITAYGHGRETLQEPLNNIARITLGTLGYFFGGAHSLFNGSYDEAASTPTEESVKIAIRTQQILYHELGLSDTIDPLGGSYYLEYLTKTVEKEIREFMEKVDEQGGPINVINNGYISRIMTDGAVRRQTERAQNKRVQAGVNIFKDPQAKQTTKPFKVKSESEEKMKQSLKTFRKNRDNEVVEVALKRLGEAAKSEENIVPATIDAVRAYATIGEMTEVLKTAYGEYKQRPTF